MLSRIINNTQDKIKSMELSKVILSLLITSLNSMGVSAAYKDMSFDQYFLVPENAVNTDYCGIFQLYFTLEDSLYNVSYKIIGGNTSNTFSINSSGEIYIANHSTLRNGRYFLQILTKSGDYEDSDKAIIDVIDVSNCVFVDPTFSGSSNGSRSNPYKSWRDANAPFAGGKAYFQKRNTISYEDYISIRTSGTTNNRIRMGAYGSGNIPVLDGNEKTTIHNGITVGAYEPETIIGHVNIYDLEVMEYSKYGVRLTIGSRDVELHRVYAHNNGSAGGSGIKCENRTRTIDDLPSEHRLYSVRSVNNDAHGIKFTGGNSSILNAYCSGNGGNGISALGGIYQNIRHCFVQNNTQFGIKITSRYSSISNVLSRNNYMGVFIGDGGEDVYYINANDIDFRNSYVVNNRTVGVYVGRYVYNINVEKNVIRNNEGSGINIGEEPTNLTIQRNILALNGGRGIYLNAGGSHYAFHYNSIFANKKNGFSLYLAGGNVALYNNTLYNNDGSGYDVYIANNTPVDAKNNIYESIGGYIWSEKSNLKVQNGSIFVDDINYDMHLKSTATIAIDRGVDVRLNSDLDGNYVPCNLKPDMGCYEYNCSNTDNIDNTAYFDVLVEIARMYGKSCSGCPQDLDNNGLVDFDDIVEIGSKYDHK